MPAVRISNEDSMVLYGVFRAIELNGDGGELTRMAADHIRGYFGSRFNSGHIAERITALRMQMTRSPSPTDSTAEASLVDVMVGILQGQSSRNRLAGQTLSNLRDQLLLPDELHKVRDQLAASIPIHCGLCSTPVAPGEMMTYHQESSRGEPIWACTRCLAIDRTACSVAGCKAHAVIKPTVIRALFASRCEEHVGKRNQPTNLPQAPEDVENSEEPPDDDD